MAEITTPHKSNSRKYQHKIIRVDLTPMVDLGFLLITFFILTTTMQQQTEMNLVMPDTPIHTPVPVSKVLTFILNRNDSIGYYEGDSKQIKYAGFAAMRNIIQQKQLNLAHNGINKAEMILIIKPTKESSYKNFIDALDEININDCRTYFIAEPEKGEVL